MPLIASSGLNDWICELPGVPWTRSAWRKADEAFGWTLVAAGESGRTRIPHGWFH